MSISRQPDFSLDQPALVANENRHAVPTIGGVSRPAGAAAWHDVEKAQTHSAGDELECVARPCRFAASDLSSPEHKNSPSLRCLLSDAGRRYFEVDDERGIIFYFRTRQAQQWDEPAKHFKLSTLL